MKFKKMSLQKKIYICCFTLNLILLFISTGIFYCYTTNSLNQNMEDTLISNTSMLKKDLDLLLETVDNTLKELQTSPSLISIAKKHSRYRRKLFFLSYTHAFYFPERFSFCTVFSESERLYQLHQ